MKNLHIKEWEVSDCPIDFKCVLILRKRQEKLKTHGRDARLIVIRRKIQHLTGMVM